MTASAFVAGALLATCPIPGGGRSPIEAAISANATRFGIPAAWIASVISAESGTRACLKGRAIRSPAGAAGVMQLMKPTWTEMRQLLGLGSSIDDPADNIAAGTAYLRLMYDRFGYPGAFAAYNAGPARYGQSLAGRPLPKETRRYLEAILARIDAPSPAPAASSAPGPSTLFVSARPMQHLGDPEVTTATAPTDDLLFVLKR